MNINWIFGLQSCRTSTALFALDTDAPPPPPDWTPNGPSVRTVVEVLLWEVRNQTEVLGKVPLFRGTLHLLSVSSETRKDVLQNQRHVRLSPLPRRPVVMSCGSVDTRGEKKNGKRTSERKILLEVSVSVT